MLITSSYLPSNYTVTGVCRYVAKYEYFLRYKLARCHDEPSSHMSTVDFQVC